MTPSGISHSYDQGIAIGCKSIVAAVLYTNICLWIKHNILSNHEQIDGHTWTFQSIPYMMEFFPEFSEKNIRDGLDALTKNKLLIKAQYSKNKFDRTNWYALPDESILKLERFSKKLFDTPQGADAEAPGGGCNKNVGTRIDISSKEEDICNPPLKKTFFSPDLSAEDRAKDKGKLIIPLEKWQDYIDQYGEAAVKKAARELSNKNAENPRKYKATYLTLLTFIKKPIEWAEEKKSKEAKDKKFDFKKPSGIGEASFRPKTLEELFEEEEAAEKAMLEAQKK